MGFVSRTLSAVVALSLFGVTSYYAYLLLRKKVDFDPEDDDYFSNYYSTIPITPYPPGHHRNHGLPNPECTVKVPFPAHLANIVIGRNGIKLREIEAQSNAKLSIVDHPSGQPVEENVKYCVVKGIRESCVLAEHLIHQVISRQPLIETVELTVGSEYVGRIIGRDGSKIREISDFSGAKINFDTNRNSKTRQCTITGVHDEIMTAKCLIKEHLEMLECEDRNKRKASKKPKKSGKHKSSQHNNQKKSDNNVIVTTRYENTSPVPDYQESRLEVFVSAMQDPSKFWIQVVGPKSTELDILVEDMSDYYRDADNRALHTLGVDMVQIGDLVAAVFKFDNKWYRAKVMEILPTKKEEENTEGTGAGKEQQSGPLAKLYYVDYGDTDQVALKDLYELRTDFLHLHFQAIETFLAKVDPINEKWSEEAIDYFEECAHVGQWKKMWAKISCYRIKEIRNVDGSPTDQRCESPIPGVELFDLENDVDIDVGKVLVEHKHATFRSDPEPPQNVVNGCAIEDNHPNMYL